MPNQVFPEQVCEDISDQDASLIRGGQMTVIDNILDVPPREVTDPTTRRIVSGVAVIQSAMGQKIRIRLKSYDHQ